MKIKRAKGKVEGKKEVRKRKGTEEIVKEREEEGMQRRWRRKKICFQVRFWSNGRGRYSPFDQVSLSEW